MSIKIDMSFHRRPSHKIIEPEKQKYKKIWLKQIIISCGMSIMAKVYTYYRKIVKIPSHLYKIMLKGNQGEFIAENFLLQS